MNALRRWAFPIFALIMLALPLLPVPDFWITQSNMVGLYAIVALGLVLLTGVAGLTSFGQAAFVGVGAYAAGYMVVTLNASPWLALVVGVALAVVAALLLGLLTLRMSGHYLPLATICWGLALNYTMANMAFLGKYDGINGIPSLDLFGFELGSGRGLHGLIWAVALVCAVAVTNLLDSRVGRAIRSLKTGSTMAEAMGIMAVLGGVGHVWGAFLGAGGVKIIEDELQVLLPALLGSSGNFEVIVFGVVLVLVLKYAPDGLWTFIQKRLPAVARPVDWTDDDHMAHEPKPAKGTRLLEVDKVRKEFGGLVAVNDVSFHIDAGEIIGLIGPNGAGKSTTFNLITGVLPLTSGRVSWRGESIAGLPSREIARRAISRTFQHVKMIPEMTVLENVALGAYIRSKANTVQAMLALDKAEERQIFAEAHRQLRRIGMEDRMHELAGNLALGPQRLMEIARALCTDPSLLLLDEPAAGLRHKEKRALSEVLKQLRGEGVTLLLVEHDMDFVMGLTDRIVVMEFGTKLMEGTPAEVQASPAVRAAYLGTEH